MKLTFKISRAALIISLTNLLIISSYAQPVITSFSPASGSIGTLVTISGTALDNPTVFTIGGTVNSAGNFTVTPSLIPTVQQGSKLIGTDNTVNSWQGWSVFLSADGNTAIIRGYSDDYNTGAAWVYLKNI
jgi:hypothetical protein